MSSGTSPISTMAPVMEVWGDVFAMPTALAHAVSSDFHMSAGVADGFREYFGCVQYLKDQRRGVGEVAYLQHNSTYIFYLITKQNYYDKYISLDSVSNCLSNLRELCVSLGVREVSMPRIGCGLDLLSWSNVYPRIVNSFRGCSVRVTVVTPPPHFRGMAVLGDSQALRFLLSKGVLPDCTQRHPYPRSAGLSFSGFSVHEFIQELLKVPDNGLGNVLVFIGTNDLIRLCKATSGKKVILWFEISTT